MVRWTLIVILCLRLHSGKELELFLSILQSQILIIFLCIIKVNINIHYVGRQYLLLYQLCDQHSNQCTEYIISLWIRAQKINNNPTLLPDHLLCLKLSLSSNITHVISSLFNDVLRSDIPTIVDVSPGSWSTIVRGFVLPHALPTLRYSSGASMALTNIEAVVQQLQNTDQVYGTDQKGSNLDILQRLADSYLFTVGPHAATPFKALYGLAKEFGWKQIGVIVGNDLATEVHSHDIYVAHADLK